MSTVPRACVAIGVDVGATKIRAVRLHGGEMAEAGDRVATPRNSPSAVGEAVVESIRSLIPDGGACSVGVATLGTVDPESRMLSQSFGFIPGWAGFDLRHVVEDAVSAPTTILNDCHAHGLAEAAVGAAAASRYAFVVAVGSGIGASVVVESVPVEGARGLAGAFGHVPSPHAVGLPCRCGAIGHLEVVASGFGMAGRYASERREAQPPTLESIVRLADRGDREALAVLRQGGQALGEALAAALAILDPEIVVLTGGASAPHPVHQDALEEALLTHGPVSSKVPLLHSSLGGVGASIGAAIHALRSHSCRKADRG